MEVPITLIIKAPNQQIEDQTIHCEINWTVKKLKGHLSEVYPTKPRFEDQKLIYSGQLLTDSTTLKDVLRIYEGQENHTVHLVCSPSKESLRAAAQSSKKPSPMPPPQSGSQEQPQSAGTSSNTSGGEGLRQRLGHVYGSHHPFSFAQPAGQTPPPVFPMFGAYDSTSLAQQMALMQQAYAQYMTQYMQLMASGNMPMGMPNMNTAPPAAPHPPPLREEPAADNEPAMNPEEEEERGNRDWLDWFYISSRLFVLLSIVYFYSSPWRFFFVSTLGMVMYLYQVGFFRPGQRLEQQEEVPVTPPPTPDNNNAPPLPETPPAPPTILALSWAAFTSFFVSLIPEQPNIL